MIRELRHENPLIKINNFFLETAPLYLAPCFERKATVCHCRMLGSVIIIGVKREMGRIGDCSRLNAVKRLTLSQNLEGVSLHVFCGFVVWLQDGQTNRPDVIKQVVPSVPGKAIDTIPSEVHTMPQNKGIFRPAISICLTLQLQSKSPLSV